MFSKTPIFVLLSSDKETPCKWIPWLPHKAFVSVVESRTPLLPLGTNGIISLKESQGDDLPLP